VPPQLLPLLLPPAFGYDPATTVGGAADLFASRGGPLFDRLAATEAAATLVLRALFTPARAHRLATQVGVTVTRRSLPPSGDHLGQMI